MLSVILAPFSWLYGIVVGIRNFLYDIGVKKSNSFPQAVICVGNLSVGGTGKTPMIEYLVRLLKNDFAIAILSRGYGRKTHGFRLASEIENASTLGDEPFQFYSKFKNKIEVAVCEDRVSGIKKLLEIKPSITVVLLDDAFQHRAVKPLFSILLTQFSKPFFADFLLPRGRLRESRNGSKRADTIIVTKCPSPLEYEQIEKSIQKYSEKPVFFSEINYCKPVSIDAEGQIKKNIVLVTGIANSRPMEDYIAIHFSIQHHFRFADHYAYTSNDVERIQRKATAVNASILTTEKDMVKFQSLMLEKKLWFYLPIETHFIKNGSEFDRMILEKINHFSTLHN